ncbi:MULTISPECIES: hypothetical protein [Pseudoalteromonas]|jgi:hypothetical protein|uniref:Uncharacterized protein n=1 Tax=Pseudoalteromonas aliena SW19 TaxID=1314866 RepID=A0ABR9E4K4_9GAMM|nr:MULTISPECIES: hypothetical protein [Pseudoalteromonas]MBE0361551.1 hypothetical protein [Pseudoalteromonas aliena SW19]TMN94854.1 hypothetical protein CWB66_18965 [Pseudoalteromonas sp. S558]
MPSDDLLNSLNSTPIEDIAQRENKKNSVDDAHEKEKVTQSENRTKIGIFLVDWAIALITIVTVLIVFMTVFHVWEIIQTPSKLEETLLSVYSEIKIFVVKYQSVIAVIATLMFGDKIKGSKKKSN